MVKQCASCRQAFPSFDDHQTCAHCRYAAGTCQIEASKRCQVCQGWSPKAWGNLKNPSVMLESSLQAGGLAIG